MCTWLIVWLGRQTSFLLQPSTTGVNVMNKFKKLEKTLRDITLQAFFGQRLGIALLAFLAMLLCRIGASRKR